VRRLPDFLLRRLVCGLIFFCAFSELPARCQEPAPSAVKPARKSVEASEKAPEPPAQIELLETRVRFEVNGDSRKEVHTRVHINNELGTRQFARLAFDYNRSFQQIEFPLVRITYSGGGTVDILPGAISDQPNPAVVNAPAYQDVRVKSLRILGLAPNDILEYRVVTTTSHHPLAPDFWLDHTFDRSGVVTHEIFELDLPAPREISARINPGAPAQSTTESGNGSEARRRYLWDRSAVPVRGQTNAGADQDNGRGPDVALTTFSSWNDFSERLFSVMQAVCKLDPATFAKAAAIAKEAGEKPLGPLYDFVSQKINTVDLPLGSTGFRTRCPADVLDSGYGTAEDKSVLFVALSSITSERATLAFVQSPFSLETAGLPRPSAFDHVLAVIFPGHWTGVWMDPSLSVAPLAMIPSSLRGRAALLLTPGSADVWKKVSPDPPFAASQSVNIDATLALDGALRAHVRYTMRGDNELLLRVAFHQAPREKWKEVAQLLALSDGFRGKITSVSASDPYATNEPFTVEYEITQPKFVDWSKKPVRIPALLPLVGLPDPPAKSAADTATSAIELGTPLDVETHLTLHLPAGTAARTPTGTSVDRDYATFASRYQASGDSVTASRHLNFLLREISTDRAADYNAFVRAVQSDEAQEFTLERGNVASTHPAADKPTKKN
jgi:hypothetical protein